MTVSEKVKREKIRRHAALVRRNRRYAHNVVKKLRKEIVELKAKLRKVKHAKSR